MHFEIFKIFLIQKIRNSVFAKKQTLYNIGTLYQVQVQSNHNFLNFGCTVLYCTWPKNFQLYCSVLYLSEKFFKCTIPVPVQVQVQRVQVQVYLKQCTQYILKDLIARNIYKKISCEFDVNYSSYGTSNFAILAETTGVFV